METKHYKETLCKFDIEIYTRICCQYTSD